MSPIFDIFAVSSAILVSLGGGGAIVFLLSSFLGKVWANRILEAEKARYSKELENIRNELGIDKEKHLKGYSDKIAIYRLSTDIVADILADFDIIRRTGTLPPDVAQRWDRFNRERMRAYGYLAMLAPQSVMDKFDALFDFLLQVMNGNASYDWQEVRSLVISLVNEVRKDIGIDTSPIEYKGNL